MIDSYLDTSNTAWTINVCMSLCPPTLSVPCMQLECSLLKAATEGNWEAIQQAFHTPSQEEVVQRVRNKVIYAEGLVPCFSIPYRYTISVL